MASKKRRSSTTSMEVPNPNPNTPSFSPSLDSSDASDHPQSDDDTATHHQSNRQVPQNLKPMERRKKRKALDKERHRADHESRDLSLSSSKNKTRGEEEEEQEPRRSALPELRIGLFRDLSSVDSAAREAAAEALAGELREVQAAYERAGGGEGEKCGVKLEAEKDDGLQNCAGSVRYAVRRLVRGISSSRECARQGFALALTAVLASVPAIKVDSVMKLIVNLLEISSSMKGQEAKDSLLGRLFAYGSVARSGRIRDDWASGGNPSCIEEFVSQVLYLAGKKQYLREPSASVILELAKQLSSEALSAHVLGARSMHQLFEKAIRDKNPDALFLALKLQERVSWDGDVFGELLPRPFGFNSFFSSEHLTSLIPCFQESTFCQPRVHSIWPVVADLLMSIVASREEDAAIHSSKKHKKSRKGSTEDALTYVKNFIEVIIEGALLTSSHDRKNLAFEVVLLLLPRLPASCIHILASYKLVHCLMDILSTKGTWLYGAAQHFLNELVNGIGNDIDRLVGAIVSLQKHSNGRFDCITRTHTVKDLVTRFNTSPGCIQFVHSLINLFIEGGGNLDELSDQSHTTDENSEKGSREDSPLVPGSNDSLKNWIVDALPRIIKNLRHGPEVKPLTSNPETVKFLEAKFRVQAETMKFLAIQGLFSASLGTEVTSFELQEKFRWPKIASSTSLRELCIEQLQYLMEDAQKDGSHLISYELETNDLGSYFICFLNTLCNIPSVSLFRALSSEDEKSFKKLQEVEARLFQEERKIGPGSDANKLHAIRYLLIQLLLQVLLRPGEFSEAALELVICCRKAFPGYFETDLMEEDNEFESEDNGAPEMIDVLVDTLLSLLPQSSAPLCYAVEQVFRFFCTEIAGSGIVRMLRVVKKDLKPLRHQVEESGDEDDEDEDEDMLGVEDADDTDEVETADAVDSDDQADDSKEKHGSDLIGMGDDDMDDEAMFRMDSYITQFLKKSGKSGNNTATSQLMIFKFRVLSLLEIYLQKNPGKSQVLTIYSYLTRAFVNYSSAEGFKQLSERIGGILQKKIFKAKEYPKGTEIPVSTLETMLEKSLRSASRAKIKSVSSLAQNSALWLLKIIQSRNFSESELDGVMKIFQQIFVDYFNSKKCRLKPDFLKEILKRYPSFGSQLFAFLLGRCSSAKSEFRQVEALDFIDSIMKSCVATNKGDTNRDRSRKSKFLKAHLPQVCCLIQQLVTKLPEKQSRRAVVRKFCTITFESISFLNLNKSFLKSLEADAQSACESQLGDAFRALRNQRKGD